MTAADAAPCPLHRGQLLAHCGPCRSERIADPAAEPDQLRVQTGPRRRRPRRLRIPNRGAHLHVVPEPEAGHADR